MSLTDASKAHLIAFVEINFVSILARRFQRLAPQGGSA